jgi:hypothetical protein
MSKKGIRMTQIKIVQQQVEPKPKMTSDQVSILSILMPETPPAPTLLPVEANILHVPGFATIAQVGAVGWTA